MRRRLPPLNSVRAFEAAARHLSFVEAADELAVTPSAVSQQVKQLEEWLGVTLFRRMPRGLTATQAALRYLPDLTEALDQIDRATMRMERSKSTHSLTVSTLSSFAALWLSPRLHRFTALHPEIDVLLSSSDRVYDMARENIDIAIRYGSRTWPDLHVEELMDDHLGIVCSADLARDPERPINKIEDIARHTLLHDADAQNGSMLSWPRFLQACGVTSVDSERGPRFSDSQLIVQACIAGRGVMIGRSSLIAEAMDSGLLVAPFGMDHVSEHRYRLVALPGTYADPKLLAFRNWIYHELGKEPPPLS